MTLNAELQAMRERMKPTTIEGFIAAGLPITEKDMEEIKAVGEKHYQNRERIPEGYLKMCDLYVELCGKDQDGQWNQVPTQRVLSDWLLTFEEWKQERLTPKNIKDAFVEVNAKFGVGRPGALTTSAMQFKTKGGGASLPEINTAAIEATKQAVQEKFSGEFVPRPAYIERPKNIPPSTRKARR